MQLTPNLVVYRVEVRTFGCTQSWSDEDFQRASVLKEEALMQLVN